MPPQKKNFELNNSNNSSDFIEYSDIGVVFFYFLRDLEIAQGIANAFLMGNNLYFNIENCEDYLFRLFVSEELSPQLVEFCLSNCKNYLELFDSLSTMFRKHRFFIRFLESRKLVN